MASTSHWDLDEDYFLPLRILLLARGIERETARDLSAFGITVAEWRVLAQCSRQPSTAGEIAAVFDSDRAEVSRAVAGLLKAKHIHREPDRSHRQKMRITPTESGWQIIAGVREMRSAYFDQILQDVSPEDRRTLNTAMRSIAARVEEIRSTRKSGT